VIFLSCLASHCFSNAAESNTTPFRGNNLGLLDKVPGGRHCMDNSLDERVGYSKNRIACNRNSVSSCTKGQWNSLIDGFIGGERAPWLPQRMHPNRRR
jgi:hypothetical protein